MASKYILWIEQYRQRIPSTLGRCREASAKMHEAFPELRIVKGHVYCQWGKRSHSWLQCDDGTVVDPTADQFGVILDYEEWNPGDEVRVGKCMECGENIWREVDTLSDPAHVERFCGTACENTFALQF